MNHQPAAAEAGVLYVCGTPIGNLGDVTQRLLDTLARVDWIAAEDTRQTRKLLAHFDIHTVLIAYHEHNRARRDPELLARLLAGESGALVTDAGMPAISDPGQTLVDAAQQAGVPVRVVPGPSAVTAALALAGLPASRWCFEGFLPRQGRLRQQRLNELRQEQRTVVLFEAPHRLVQTLRELAVTCGPRPAAVLKELTKRYEGCERGSLEQLADQWQGRAVVKGEFCIVIGPAEPPSVPSGGALGPTDQAGPDAYRQRIAQLQAGGMTRSAAVRVLAAELGLHRAELYGLLYAAADDPPPCPAGSGPSSQPNERPRPT